MQALLGTYTTATLPSPASVIPGTQAYTTDDGLKVSDGKKWSGGTARRVLLDKIRATMAAAATGQNPVELPPWLPPTSVNPSGNQIRANLTSYPLRTVFTNAAGTHQFVVRVTGTTAAAEPATITTPIVAANPYNMGDIIDGGVSANWLGPVRTTTALAGAPTVTTGARPAALSLAVSYSPTVAGSAPDARFRVSGGIGALAGFTGGQNILTYLVGPAQPTLNPVLNSNNNYATYCSALDFVTDAWLIAFDQGTTGSQALNTNLSIEVDGRRLCDGPLVNIAAVGGGNAYVLLDFRGTGMRKDRHFRLSCSFNAGNAFANFGKLWVSPQDAISFHTNANRWRLACVGDSIFGGSSSGPLISRWDRASVFGDLIGCDDVANLGVGGTGFIANASGAQLTYIQRIQDLITLNPDVVYIGGAFNDSVSASAARQAAALLYYQAVRAALPLCMIVQAGTYGGVAPATNQAIDADLLAALTAFGDANSFFIPVSTDTPAWGTGTGNLGGVNNSGNSDIYIGPSDATHPSQYAIASYLAFRDANAFRNLINSL